MNLEVVNSASWWWGKICNLVSNASRNCLLCVKNHIFIGKRHPAVSSDLNMFAENCFDSLVVNLGSINDSLSLGNVGQINAALCTVNHESSVLADLSVSRSQEGYRTYRGNYSGIVQSEVKWNGPEQIVQGYSITNKASYRMKHYVNTPDVVTAGSRHSIRKFDEDFIVDLPRENRIDLWR